MANPTELLEIAVTAAQRAGAVITSGLHSGQRLVNTKSTATDLVTEMDHASEETIVSVILETRPDDSIVAEEGARHQGSSDVTWVVDPIDGTTNYVYGHPGFAISIAAQRGSQTIAAVVSDPLHGDLYTATVGGGSYRNGVPVAVSGKEQLPTALVATGFSYLAERRREQAQVVSELISEVRDIRRMGAASVDLCSVASGRVDAYYERWLSPWDFAAGILIATEAGATVGDLSGGVPSPDFVLASSPAVFDELCRLLLRSGAAGPASRRGNQKF